MYLPACLAPDADYMGCQRARHPPLALSNVEKGENVVVRDETKEEGSREGR